MRHFILPVCLLAACANGTDDADGDNAAFTRVDNQSDARLVLADSDHWDHGSSMFHVDCVSDVHDDLSVDVKDGELVIVGDNASDCDVSIVVTGVDSVTISGDGDLDCDERLGINDLELFVRGNGEIHVEDLQGVHVGLDLSGSGAVSLAGATESADITMTGNGSLVAGDLWIDDLAIDMTGSAEATVRVTGTIAGEVGGSGTLEVYGDPDGDVTTSGSGEVLWL